ncbi:CHAT domain-containing protein [Calothrix sp. CCY 0018]|uniref:CHAT domain-containing protein n=1 Tax=Calothrix sp. CCY 0018 TaxID=3103864 RepID=UPI0039C5FA5B
MQILHFNLKFIQDNYVELRYFEDNKNKYQSRSLPLTEIADLIQLAEQDYYVPLPEDYVKTGTKLFNWLDGDRFFQQLLDKQRGKGVVLALSTSGNIAHLPWELLHNGKCFLVETKPGIIPVRWVLSDTTQKISIKPEPENRALQMLFMAASPLNVKPVLDFEKEEASILTATARQPLTLTVEESGCLEELGYLVEDYGKEDDKQYFDVLHLTGHATIKDGIPAFITESPTGEAIESTADDIATELQFQLPKLIFLSGCRTAQAGNSGAVPSMAESLLNAGATSVLGWGQKVLDTDATAAAAALYQALSAGKLLTEALVLTYQALIKNKARDWHLLRLYVGDTLPGNLVTSLRTRGRKPAPPRSFNAEFLDPAGKVKVPTRESFVGRRRQLQSCLRSLINPSSEEIGVLIHGMGGLGKSSLAARLCDRLTNFQRVVWVGGIDEASLVNRLTEKLDNQELRETLQNPDEELKFRLKKVFGWLQETGDNPFLLILDDFEANLEPRNDSYILQPEAAKVLSALVWAIRDIYASDRIIITCRYDFESTYLQQFYKQPLEGMHGADLRKKLNRLAAFEAQSQVDETLRAKAQLLADGNPRLLEWLDKLLQSNRDLPTDNVTTVIATQGSNPKHPTSHEYMSVTNVDIAAILDKLEIDSGELREQVLAEELLQQMDNTMREILQLGLVFELPVPREALAAVCESIVDLGNYIDKAVALGLLEVSPDESLRVPRILPLKLSGDMDLCKKASQVLYRLWWEEADKAELLWFGNIPHLINYPFSWMKITETTREERMLEISRLALQGKEKRILVNIGSFIARRWNYNNRWQEAANICQEILKLVEDYRIFHNLSISQGHLGNIDKALVNCHKALELCSLEHEG